MAILIRLDDLTCFTFSPSIFDEEHGFAALLISLYRSRPRGRALSHLFPWRAVKVTSHETLAGPLCPLARCFAGEGEGERVGNVGISGAVNVRIHQEGNTAQCVYQVVGFTAMRECAGLQSLPSGQGRAGPWRRGHFGLQPGQPVPCGVDGDQHCQT
jgi:hypothetical protein